MPLRFLTLGEVLAIHQDQLRRYGGKKGIRDIHLLSSAIAMPSATFAGQFLHTNRYEMAAAYLFHLVQNHPLVDGNKRTGTVTALVFLALHGEVCNAPEEALVDMVLQVAGGKSSKADIALWLRKWCA